MKRQKVLFFGVPVIVIGIFLLGSYIFQDNISRFFINPRIPFQTSPTPPKPDYDLPQSWVLWREGSQQPPPAPEGETATKKPPQAVDIFYVHGTTYSNRKTWNSRIDDTESLTKINQIAIPNEVGPFAPYGHVYAPLYRQATLYTRFTHKFDGLAARELAYNDVKAAFTYYLESANPEVPLIMVGYNQGGLYITGLLNEFFETNQALKNRLVTAYIIQNPIAEKSLTFNIPACVDKLSTGCIINYNYFEEGYKREINDVRTRALEWTAQQKLTSIIDSKTNCINPLSWSSNDNQRRNRSNNPKNNLGSHQSSNQTSDEGQGDQQNNDDLNKTNSSINTPYVDARHHIGAASATGLKLNQSPPLTKQAIGAQCRGGVLIVDKSDKPFLRQKHWFGQQWQPKNYNLFYGDLSQDAKRRITIHRPLLAARVRQLTPIEETIDFKASPVKKVPN